MAFPNKKVAGSPFVGYGVVKSRLRVSPTKLRQVLSFSAYSIVFILTLAAISTGLSSWYQEYYESKQLSTKRVTDLRNELDNLSMKHEAELSEMKNLIFDFQIMILERRVSDSTASIDERAQLEFVRKKKLEFEQSKIQRDDLSKSKSQIIKVPAPAVAPTNSGKK